VRIERFISGVGCLDGGTTFWEVLLDDGTVLEMGRDGHLFPERKTHGLLFIGDSHPELGKVRFLAKGSVEENELIIAVSDYLDRNCGGGWRESLHEGERRAEFAKGDDSVEVALGFLSILEKR
jgi:hypothetical protein